MKRKIVTIDENICNGCGLCVEGCYEGAIQVIDGKARVMNEAFCDGLGACIGKCPVGAIEIEERDAAPYIETSDIEHGGCPGSMELSFKKPVGHDDTTIKIGSQLTQWPIQLHLLNPQSSFFKNADVILAADCTAYAFGNFHDGLLKNHSLAIACPKLDSGKEEYIEKITAMINLSRINSLTVIIMEVPCCTGLLQLAQQAAANAERKIPVKKIVVGIQGEILKDEWI
jgi:NAD-dependent dihydropyrimidine dehydrogenase PreA subunit